MKVAVTGASGHIGGNLVRALLEAGHAVRALYSKDTRPLDGLKLEQRRADVLDPASLEAAFEGREVVFHLAGKITVNGDPDGMVNRINGEGVRNVCEAAMRRRGRLCTSPRSTPSALPLGPAARRDPAAVHRGSGLCLTTLRQQGERRALVREY
jgi:nucleoside-diphosphate-sugar epimerase